MVTETIPFEKASDEPTTKAIMRSVYSVGRRFGYSLPSVEEFECGKLNSDDRARGGVTPNFVHDDSNTSDAIWSGTVTPFSWSDEVPGAGTSEGSAHMTTGYVRGEKRIEEMVVHLCETGQIDEAIDGFDNIVAEGVDPVEVTFYATATYAKGWFAEEVITSCERFSKGSQSNDESGQDVFDCEQNQYRQVRPVTNRENNYDNCLYYQWTCRGEIVVGGDFKEVNKVAGEVSGRVIPYTGEIKPTLTLRSHSSYRHNGRMYRYIWW